MPDHTVLPRVITSAWLAEHDACPEPVARVRACWPDGAPVTAETLVEAAGLGLAITWLVRFLPAPIRARYRAEEAPIWARHRAEMAPIWTRHDADLAPIWECYGAGMASPIIRERYRVEVTPILGRHRAEWAPIEARHRAERASLLAAAWQSAAEE